MLLNPTRDSEEVACTASEEAMSANLDPAVSAQSNDVLNVKSGEVTQEYEMIEDMVVVMESNDQPLDEDHDIPI